jgi:hypothetical protein
VGPDEGIARGNRVGRDEHTGIVYDLKGKSPANRLFEAVAGGYYHRVHELGVQLASTAIAKRRKD